MAEIRQALRDDLRLALDRVAFARGLRIVPDGWQEDFLRSSADTACCDEDGPHGNMDG
jgi:hypothetical protein